MEMPHQGVSQLQENPVDQFWDCNNTWICDGIAPVDVFKSAGGLSVNDLGETHWFMVNIWFAHSVMV